MAAEEGYPVAGGGGAKLRAADADRDHVAGILGTAYSEGRLSKDEYDERLHSALTARTFGDLDRVVTDLPVPQATAPRPPATRATATPAAGPNGYALASFVCGLAQFVFGPLATVPAIIFGHMARSQIRRTGEPGAGLALAGLILGWGAVIFGIIVVIGAVLAVAAGTHGSPMPMPMH
jgi:DUF1707 SHOCT-like domain/Domain of unknown function (DUF4190)